MTLTITGTLVSKYAAHVPVFRNWKLVWERREFGTRRDHGTWAVDLPEAGGTVKVTGDWSIDVKFAHEHVNVSLLWNGLPVPHASFRRKLSLLGRWDWDIATKPWKGVSLDVKAELSA